MSTPPNDAADKAYRLNEAVADLALSWAMHAWHPSDSRDLVRLVIKWAEEFEAVPCDDDNYLDRIDAFFNDKYQAWLEETPASQRHSS